MKNLYIIGPKIRKSEYIGLWQIHPFSLYKSEFRKAGYNVIRKHGRTAKEIHDETLNLNQPDIIMIRPDWPEDPQDILNLCKGLREKYTDSKIIFIDPFDQTSSRFFESLPYLDAFIKYQSLSDKDLYLNDYRGGVYALEKLKNECGILVDDDWSVKSEVEPGQQHKIVSGNMVIEPRLIRKIKSPINNFLLSMKEKNLDLFCHLSCGERDNLEWYGKHRVLAVEQMQTLSNFNISVAAEYSGEPRLPRKEYVKRQKASKIVFSPLGWGELTMRAFEALANRSLLVQPDVSHLDIYPNIFIPNETYVPVKWDFSDLAEKCEYYMSNESKRVEIVNNAREAFLKEYTAERFIQHMEGIFNL